MKKLPIFGQLASKIYFLVQNEHEFPRQENGDNVNEPELSQFRASQILLDPNITSQTSEVASLSVLDSSFLDDDEERCIEAQGYDVFSALLSDEEEDENLPGNIICTAACCKPPISNSLVGQNSVHRLQVSDFTLPKSTNLAFVIEKHDEYLIRLKESDKRLQPILPLALLNNPCTCGRRCDALLSINEICRMRITWPLPYRERIACQFYFVKTLMENKVFVPFIKSHDVCVKFFCDVNIIPLERVNRFVELINEGIENPVHPNTGKRFEHESTVEKLGQLALYISENFDSNPAKQSFLPQSRITKSTAAGEAFNIPFGRRRRYNFTKFFKKITAKTHFVSGNSLTKCNICTSYSFKLRKTSLSAAEKAAILLEWEQHKIKVRNDRRCYKFRCILSTEQPNKYGSLIHDGMSKMACKLPLNNDHRAKKIEDNDRMFCGLNLAIIHQKSMLTCLITCFPNRDLDGQNKTTTIGFFSPGSCYDNTTNAIISQILFSIASLPVVPPTIFIQIDNFPGNKSYLFFAVFGYLLLLQNSIREFYISFMMPGHTHCDVDGRFGNFSTFLNAKECGSPQELISAFLECIPGQAQMKQSIYNFKEVLTPLCYNYGTLKSMYDFHLYLDGNNVPTVENARFDLSETLLCGSRQNQDSFVSKLFKKMPPLNLNFQLVLPKMDGIEKMITHIPKWESVITANAKNELLNLKDNINSHVGTPFKDLLKTIQEKGATNEARESIETVIDSSSAENEEVPLETEDTNFATTIVEQQPQMEVTETESTVLPRRSTRITSTTLQTTTTTATVTPSSTSRKRKTANPQKAAVSAKK